MILSAIRSLLQELSTKQVIELEEELSAKIKADPNYLVFPTGVNKLQTKIEAYRIFYINGFGEIMLVTGEMIKIKYHPVSEILEQLEFPPNFKLLDKELYVNIDHIKTYNEYKRYVYTANHLSVRINVTSMKQIVRKLPHVTRIDNEDYEYSPTAPRKKRLLT
ncbi:hypothetical protein [Paenibacillus thailandensis]|uniref:LytTR family transcriptional regulator n=1 Tax=Paenibacillus thailandensis TaxID=393250 RepID=A0ABW5R2X6_9BACL